MQAESGLLVLPPELLLRIFGFVYDPWSLEIELRRDVRRELYHKKAIVRARPSSPNTAPLAICKSMHVVAKEAMVDAFTGVINSRDAPTLGVLEHILCTPQWVRIRPRVISLSLPNIPYSLSTSKDFIMLFPALKQVELDEVLGLWTALVAEPAGDTTKDIQAIPNEHFQTRAQKHLPEIPNEIPFCCNGGDIDLLLHVAFGSQRLDLFLSMVFDVSFRVTSDLSLCLIKKVQTSITVQ